MEQRTCVPRHLLIGLFLCVFALPGYSQSTQGSIVGSVTDHSGAAIGDAKVMVISEGTAYPRSIRTEAMGTYRVSGVEPGMYTVTVSAPGFKSVEQRGVDVVSGQVKRVDATLEIGDVSTTVTVKACRRSKPRPLP
jgi:multidrug efflux pump subunit AcrA (membrane-fusion protein)